MGKFWSWENRLISQWFFVGFQWISRQGISMVACAFGYPFAACFELNIELGFPHVGLSIDWRSFVGQKWMGTFWMPFKLVWKMETYACIVAIPSWVTIRHLSSHMIWKQTRITRKPYMVVTSFLRIDPKTSCLSTCRLIPSNWRSFCRVIWLGSFTIIFFSVR